MKVPAPDFYTGIAQLVEHWSPKPGVGSSSLSSRAKINKSMFKKIVDYCKVSYEELAHKTTWPTRSELMNSAVLVLTASLCIALVVFVIDQVFQNAMEFVYGLLR